MADNSVLCHNALYGEPSLIPLNLLAMGFSNANSIRCMTWTVFFIPHFIVFHSETHPSNLTQGNCRSDVRLLKLYESGLPAWAVYPGEGGGCFIPGTPSYSTTNSIIKF
eukprot:228420-Pelagomonas_calceolata.AAC.1